MATINNRQTSAFATLTGGVSLKAALTKCSIYSNLTLTCLRGHRELVLRCYQGTCPLGPPTELLKIFAIIDFWLLLPEVYSQTFPKFSFFNFDFAGVRQ